MKPRRIIIGGLPYFGRILAPLLTHANWTATYRESAGGQPGAWVGIAAAVAGADVIYLLGGQIERWSRPDWLARFSSRPIVMHWLGSDVTYALDAAKRGRTSTRLISRPSHWAEVPWIAAELRPLGINAEIVPLTSTRLSPVAPPLPQEFTVLTYLPSDRPDFYGREVVMNLAASLPDVRFIVVGSAGAVGEGLVPSRALANVEYLGWVHDIETVHARSTVLARLPEHDGLSFMVLEALSAGRHVIWNHPFGGVLEADNEAKARLHLRRLLAQHSAGQLALNEVGRDAVRDMYSPSRVREDILGRFERLIAGAGRQGARRQ